MNRDQKAAVVDEIAGHIEAAQAIFAVNYRGISVSQIAELRAKLRESDMRFRIVKNSLSERAADKAGRMLSGRCSRARPRWHSSVAMPRWRPRH